MRTLVLFAFAALLAGCSGDIAGPAGGTYSLAAVNGAPVPYTLPEGSPYATLFSGTLSIDGGEWTQTLLYGGRPAGLITAIRTGRIRADSPSRYRFTSPAGTLAVEARGEELVFESGGATYVYRRSR
jgi:hypothetical protein